MNTQPKALRLADRLEKVRLFGVEEECWEAADELRRQHDEIEKLRGEVARLTELHTLYQDKTERLKAERDALLAALKWLDRWSGHKPMPECTAKIKAAIDAARSEK